MNKWPWKGAFWPLFLVPGFPWSKVSALHLHLDGTNLLRHGVALCGLGGFLSWKGRKAWKEKTAYTWGYGKISEISAQTVWLVEMKTYTFFQFSQAWMGSWVMCPPFWACGGDLEGHIKCIAPGGSLISCLRIAFLRSSSFLVNPRSLEQTWGWSTHSFIMQSLCLCSGQLR